MNDERERKNAEKREARRIASEEKKSYKLKLKNGEISILDDLKNKQEKLKAEIANLQATFNKNQLEIDEIMLAEKIKLIDNVSVEELKQLTELTSGISINELKRLLGK